MKSSSFASALLATAVAVPAQGSDYVMQAFTPTPVSVQFQRMPAEVQGKITIGKNRLATGYAGKVVTASGFHADLESLVRALIATGGAEVFEETPDWSNVPMFGMFESGSKLAELLDALSPDFRLVPWPGCWPCCCPPPCFVPVCCGLGVATAAEVLMEPAARASGVGNQRIVAELDLEEFWKGWNKAWKKDRSEEIEVPDWSPADPEDLEEVPDVPKKISIGGEGKGNECLIGVYNHLSSFAYEFRRPHATSGAVPFDYWQGPLGIDVAMSADDAASAVMKNRVSEDVTSALRVFAGSGYDATTLGPGVPVGLKWLDDVGAGGELSKGGSTGWAR